VSGQSREAPANTAGGPAPSQEPARLTGKQRQKLATQRKLFAAAREEFQRYGFSGGRVDRIAEMAGVNKRSIYMYFGDKAGLFDAVIRENRNAVGAAVKFDASDLPAYALRLYEYWQTHPESVRLFWWRNLERESTTDVEEAAYSGMVADIGATQRTGGAIRRSPPPTCSRSCSGCCRAGPSRPTRSPSPSTRRKPAGGGPASARRSRD
jgi:AcrR family transcriptional regulator